uniref:Uncharacterized protein n=1 Tax=Setaria digitata TaxID=48799 RepID=A0A915Q4G9_9BILA
MSSSVQISGLEKKKIMQRGLSKERMFGDDEWYTFTGQGELIQHAAGAVASSTDGTKV